jgi:hypothetical protein
MSIRILRVPGPSHGLSPTVASPGTPLSHIQALAVLTPVIQNTGECPISACEVAR